MSDVTGGYPVPQKLADANWLWEYAQEVLGSDPGTSATLETLHASDGPAGLCRDLVIPHTPQSRLALRLQQIAMRLKDDALLVRGLQETVGPNTEVLS